MFLAIKKLEKLKPALRIKKIIQILMSCEKEIRSGRTSSSYIIQAVNTVLPVLDEKSRLDTVAILKILPEILSKDDSAIINRLRHIILSFTGKEPAEWDLLDAESNNNNHENEDKILFPVSVYLDDIRSPFNLGSVFRTAEAFCFSSIYLSSCSPSPFHPRAKRSAMGTVEKVSWERREISTLTGPVFALELGGESIDRFRFPECGTVIIGSEETGVSSEGLKKAADSAGVVSIPVFSSRVSINVGVAFGILACAWISYINKKN